MPNDPEQKLAELLAIVDGLMALNEAQQKLIQALLTQNSELAAKMESLGAIAKAMK